MQKIYYHTSLLSSALSDMQRAGESKRSVAEIALTRMCEPKLMATAESLAVRLEQAEREISRMKISISAGGASAPIEEPIPVLREEDAPVAAPAPIEQAPAAESSAAPSAGVYERWNRVIERIGELKRPLSAKFIGAKVECAGNVFMITMKPFFAKSFASSAEDITLVKGAIAEIEGIPHSQLVLQIKEKSDGPALNFSNELESF